MKTFFYYINSNYKNIKALIVTGSFFVYIYCGYCLFFEPLLQKIYKYSNGQPYSCVISAVSIFSLFPVFLIEIITNYKDKKHTINIAFLQGIVRLYVGTTVTLYIISMIYFLADKFTIKQPYHIHINLLKYKYNSVIAIIIYLLIVDIIQYFGHRAMHSCKFLWKFHSIHHSIKDVYCFNAYQHIVESLFQIFLRNILISPIIILSSSPPPFLIWITTFQSAFIHANIRWIDFGFIKYFIVSPNFHRAHHHLHSSYHNKNFSFYFPIIDIVFGTYVQLKNSHLNGPFGIENKENPKKITDLICFPKI